MYFDGIVVHVDGGVDVGPQAQDLAAEIVPDRGHARAVQDVRRRHLGDHEVFLAHLLERDLRRLGVGDAMWMVGVRHAHHDVAQSVVNVAAIGDQVCIADEPAGDVGLN